jgi:hypothetical protein
MDVVSRFGRLEIPKVISRLISDFVFCWTKCIECHEWHPLEYFYASGDIVDECFYCRCGPLSVAWLEFLSDRVGFGSHTIYHFDRGNMFHLVEYPYYASMFVCRVHQCPVMEFYSALGEFRFIMGIPETEQKRYLLMESMDSNEDDYYQLLE